MGYTYVTSDTHFDGLMYTEEPDYVNLILEKWRKKVKPSDTVIHVGDVMGGRFTKAWSQKIKMLPGYKILVRGNHDGSKKEKWLEAFDEVYDKTYIRGNVVYCHYPISAKEHGCQYNIYGHLHGYPVDHTNSYVRHYRKFFSFKENFNFSIRDWDWEVIREDKFIQACLTYAKLKNLD